MILEHIMNKDVLKLKESLFTELDRLAYETIQEFYYDQDEVIEENRFKFVNRVRNGKIQRRHKVSNQEGYRFQDGKLVRMSPREKLNRKRAQRRGAIKRRAKVARSLRRRKISLHKRGAL